LRRSLFSMFNSFANSWILVFGTGFTPFEDPLSLGCP
jgi:hypothetical protein